jgi:hypothetical protein
MFQDRRFYQRLTPSSPQLVFLDESKYSLLFDLCEGGLAVEGFTAEKSLDIVSLEFDLPEGNGCIQAKAEIAWTSDSGYRTGFRFVELADNDRQQLRGWISSDSAARLALVEAELAQPRITRDTPDALLEPGAFENRSAEKLQPSTALFPQQAPTFELGDFEQGGDEALNEQRTPAYTAGIILAVVMSSISFLMGYYWRGTRAQSSLPQAPVAAAAKEPGPISRVPLNPLPTAQPSLPTNPSLDQPGFVLQVGAMEKETNADALSASLHQKNFSAFVFRRGAERLYRVVVGPFPNQESVIQIERDLEAQGFEPLIRPWSPE